MENSNPAVKPIEGPFNTGLTKGLPLLALLKSIRRLSYSDIGDACGGFTKSYICMVFHGKADPPVKLKEKLAAFFGISVLDVWSSPNSTQCVAEVSSEDKSTSLFPPTNEEGGKT